MTKHQLHHGRDVTHAATPALSWGLRGSFSAVMVHPIVSFGDGMGFHVFSKLCVEYKKRHRKLL